MGKCVPGKCRYLFPKKINKEGTKFDADGNIELQRSTGFINTFVPLMLSLLRCNMDVKPTFFGDASSLATYYMTKYMTKSESCMKAFTKLALASQKVHEQYRKALVKNDLEVGKAIIRSMCVRLSTHEGMKSRTSR